MARVGCAAEVLYLPSQAVSGRRQVNELAGTVPFLARFIAAPSRTCAPERDHLMPPTQVHRHTRAGLGTSLVNPLVGPLASGEGCP
jgi:hypothetical protein